MAEKKRDMLANELRKNVLSGLYGSQGGIPDESDLANSMGVARGTVRAALILLEGEGLIVQRGRSYYVNSLPITMTSYVPPAGKRSEHNFVKNIGNVIGMLSLPKHVALKLQLAHDATAVSCTRLSGEVVDGNEKPTQLSLRYYFLPLSKEQIQRMHDDASYDPAWDTSGVLRCIDDVVARCATSDELTALGLPDGTPVLGLSETIRDHNGKLVMFQESTLVPRIELSFAFDFVNSKSA